MEIKTFAKTEYKGHPIYVRNWNTHFEYITIIKDEVYTAHMSVRPEFLRSVLYWLGIKQTRFSKEQNDATYNYMVKMAEATIDHYYFKK